MACNVALSHRPVPVGNGSKSFSKEDAVQDEMKMTYKSDLCNGGINTKGTERNTNLLALNDVSV